MKKIHTQLWGSNVSKWTMMQLSYPLRRFVVNAFVSLSPKRQICRKLMSDVCFQKLTQDERTFVHHCIAQFIPMHEVQY